MKFKNLWQPIRYLSAATMILILSACAANRAAAPAAPAATAAAVPTEAPKPTEAATAAVAAPAVAAPAPTEAPKATEVKPTESAASAATGPIVFKIDASQSKATFTLDEKLMGNPKTVVGTSPSVNGDITVDATNPAQSKIGTIQIDASQFATDSSFRDRALKNFILQTAKEENKFIKFEPTAIEGMPAKVGAGEAISFKVTGNLVIRGVSQTATFDVSVTQKSDTELAGTAKAIVKRSAYQLEIPKVPSVADVTDDVALEFTFVAVKAA